jgi:hypothetical protein
MKLEICPFVKPLLLITLVALAFTSCKKDDPDPDYFGTWVVINTLVEGTSSLELKELIKLSGGNFEQLQQVKNPVTNKWIDFYGLKGTFTSNVKKLNFTITEAGLSAINQFTGIPNGQIEYLKSTDDLFRDFMEANGIPEAFEMEYEVDGKEITFKSDLNNDQDYSDLGETRTYTRQ